MLILLKEVNVKDYSSGSKDLTVNPEHVASVEHYSVASNETPKSKVSLINGNVHIVIGEVLDITKKLSGKKKLLLNG